MQEYNVLTSEDLVKRLKWLGYIVAILGILIYLYAGDLEKIAGKVVNHATVSD